MALRHGPSLLNVRSTLIDDLRMFRYVCALNYVRLHTCEQDSSISMFARFGEVKC